MARPVELGGKSSRFILLASVFLIITGLYFGREVLIPLALAILISFLLTPPVRWLERVGLPRIVATLIIALTGLGFMGAIGYIVGRQFIAVINELPRYEGELRTKFHSLGSHGGIIKKAQHELQTISGSASGPTNAHDGAPDQGGAVQTGPDGASGQASPQARLPAATTQPVPVTIVENPSWAQRLRQYAATILDPLATAGLVVVFVIFMLYNREDLRDRMIRLVGHGRLNVTTQALDEAGTRISHYLGALAIVNCCYAIITAGGLWVIGHVLGAGQGFPNVLVWGILVGLLRFVPYVGVWIGASFPLLLSFALFAGNLVFFATLGLFIALEVIVSQFIEPVWYGASTGMSALAVLVAAVFWTWLWGPIGLLLSTPLTVCLVVIGKHVPQLQFLDILLGDEPVLPPHVRLYQRLIASDEEEANELAHELLQKQTLEQVYDEVMIPALAMAEQDHHRGRLDERHHKFVRQNLRSLVEELADERRADHIRQAAAHTEEAAKDRAPARDELTPRPSLPKDCKIDVLCLPAKDEADEIVCLMLAQLLELRGYCATTSTADSLASEMVDMVARQSTDVVCVSAMPPSAIAHARYLCKRIHARFPEINMLVGLWLAKGDLAKAKSRIGCAETVRVVTTLAQAQHEIDQMVQPIILSRTGAETQTPVGAK